MKRRGRALNGILLVDKPEGMTSNAVLKRVKYLSQAAKVGHTGSLDPLATGLLPLCFGEATKFAQYLLDASKTYYAQATLGLKTDSADAHGTVIKQAPVPNFSRSDIEAVLQRFNGEIQQIPNMFCALKKDGRPLYELARKGVTVERPPRTQFIHRLSLEQLQLPTFDFTVHCSKGTYVRSLVDDIGEALGCYAHVSILRRTHVGPYAPDALLTLEQIEQICARGPEALTPHLLPMDGALSELPRVALLPADALRLQQGLTVDLAAAAPSAPGLHRVCVDGTRFIGLAELSAQGVLRAKRLVAYAQP